MTFREGFGETGFMEADALFARYEREDRIRYFEEKKIQGSRYDFLKSCFSLLGKWSP